MTAATLHQVCGGRYVLGLGASTIALAEGFHDAPFEHPAARLSDTVTKVRALLAGEPAQLRHASDAFPRRLGQPAPEVPIWVATLGNHTIRVAAELGDGWIPALVARDRVPPSYASAMGEVYARSVSAQVIIAANPRPSPRRGTVPPGGQVVLDQLAAYGTRDQVREQLQAWHRAADIVTIVLPPGMAWHTIEATLEAAAPSAASGVRPGDLVETGHSARSG